MTYRKGLHQLRSGRNLAGKIKTPLKVVDSSSISPQDKENQPSLSTETSRAKLRNTRRTTPHIDKSTTSKISSLRSLLENSASQSNQVSLKDVSLKECGVVEFCPVCDFSTPIFKKFEEHIKLHIFNKLDAPDEEETTECAIKSRNTAMKDLCQSAKANEISKPVHVRPTESEYACPVCDFKTSIKRSFESHIKFHVEQYNVSANIEDFTETSEPDSRVNCILVSEKDGLISDDEENNSIEIVLPQKDQSSESEECKNSRGSLIELDGFSESEKDEDPIKIDDVFNFFTFKLPDKQSSFNHAEKPCYELCFCGFISSIKDDFKKHVKTHVSSEEIAASTCDVKTEDNPSSKSDNLKELIPIPEKNETTTCDVIKNDNQKSASTITNRKKLKRHIKTVSFNIKECYSCALCIFDTSNERSLRTHIHRSHKDSKSRDKKSVKSKELIFCHTCDFICLSQKVLIAHQKLHESSKPYLCFYCKYSTNSASRLENHKKKHVPNFNCKACKYVTPSFIKFKIHIRTHVGPKPFLCTHCSFRCSQKQHMKSHMRTHTGEKPYKCSFCSFRCSTKYYRGVHEKIHTREKPYKCDKCDYECRALSYLNTHKRCHSKSKPYHCKTCGYNTRYAANFTRHLEHKNHW